MSIKFQVSISTCAHNYDSKETQVTKQ